MKEKFLFIKDVFRLLSLSRDYQENKVIPNELNLVHSDPLQEPHYWI